MRGSSYFAAAATEGKDEGRGSWLGKALEVGRGRRTDSKWLSGDRPLWAWEGSRFPCMLQSFAHLSKRCTRHLTVQKRDRMQPGRCQRLRAGRFAGTGEPEHSRRQVPRLPLTRRRAEHAELPDTVLGRYRGDGGLALWPGVFKLGLRSSSSPSFPLTLASDRGVVSPPGATLPLVQGKDNSLSGFP